MFFEKPILCLHIKGATLCPNLALSGSWITPYTGRAATMCVSQRFNFDLEAWRHIFNTMYSMKSFGVSGPQTSLFKSDVDLIKVCLIRNPLLWDSSRPIVIGQARWSRGWDVCTVVSRRSWVQIPPESPVKFFHRHSESTECTIHTSV